MENQVKVKIWSDFYENKVNSNTALNFEHMLGKTLRMTNSQYDKIFNHLLDGKTIVIHNFDLTNTTLNQALNAQESDNEKTGRISIFTSEDYTKQNTTLERLIKSEEQVYLTFGMLEYFKDEKTKLMSAPLVFLPIKIEKIDDKTYQVKNINHELSLNNILIKFLSDTKRIDISYPIENDFSLLEYLSYVSIKVRNNHFSVNNGCFISPFELNSYYTYKDFLTKSDKMIELPLVKSISYLNAEFFNLNKPSSSRLNNSYLSLLNLDNEEYKILKNINLRENVILKTNSTNNKKHLLSNIIFDFLLNNKNILLTYSNDETLKEITEIIKEYELEDFTINLSTKFTDKKAEIHRLIHNNRLEYDIKLLDQNKVDETTDYYYLLKNNFKKIVNSLRRNNEPMNLSLNRAMFEYYNLKDVILIKSEIPNAELLDDAKLKSYLKDVESFIQTLTSLKCHYKDHPFYGFKRLDLTQEDYQTLKEQIIEFSNEFEPTKKAFKNLEDNYNTPSPKTLKEMKSILNILKLVDKCITYDPAFFQLSIEEQNDIIDVLNKYNDDIDTLSRQQLNLLSIYGDKVFTLPYEDLHKALEIRPFNKKIIRQYSAYFMKKAKIDEAILTHLDKELEAYYSLSKATNEIVKKYSSYKVFYKEGHYLIEDVKEVFKNINDFNDNCKYLAKNDKTYSIKDLTIFTSENLDSLKKDLKIAQIGFNHILDYSENIQQYFDEEIINFNELPIAQMEKKIIEGSKNFISINNYLDFYVSYRKLNKTIPHLSDELLRHHDYSKYISMFIKRYYYDFINAIFKNNQLLKDYNEESYLLNIEKYENYNKTRLDIVKAIIKNNIKNRLKNNTIVLKSIELPYLNSISEQDIRALPLDELLTRCNTSCISTFPLFIIKTEEVSKILNHSSFEFDVNIVMSDDKLMTSESMSSLIRGKQLIVFDNKLLGKNDDTISPLNNEYFIFSALKSLKSINYVSSSYNENILTNNNIDISLKTYLKDKLIQQNFIVSTDVITDIGTIDLLVKVPSSTKPTAIFLDRLSYYSIESAIESHKITKKAIESLNLSYYRLMTPLFFLDEENQFDKLVKYIVLNTVSEQEKKKVKVNKPLVEVLFKTYIKPSSVYELIKDKQSKPIKDIMLELLKECAPIKQDEIEEIFKEDSQSALSQLQVEKLITIKNSFVFLNDYSITFKRVKPEEETRRFDYISNEEFATGIKMVLTKKSLSVDEMIKLMLLSTGLKKMNHDQYFRIQNIINDLIENKEISIKDEILYESIVDE